MSNFISRRDNCTAGRVISRASLCGIVILAMSGAVHAEPLTAGALAVNAAKAAVANNVIKNFEGANQEKNTVDKITKAVTGISINAIRKDGVQGGKNSFFRKPFG